ncbi:MAG TPA: cysteine hydrolase [Bacteroidales bacterium]|nr:MAG: isochorismatase [Bacteroidetes bacterium GWE2_42_24]OFY29885.1 MAG: isochorismatase [Bacteroidetes bacterium GWF2_43_11]HBZ67240.1 cysteine hydrolase [Bacteroidales bacterium]
MKKALILVDIQNDYFENGKMTLSGSNEAGENAHRILEQFRAEGETIIHIRHIAMQPGATFFIPDTKGAEIHACVKPQEHEKVVVKYFPNSFRDTGLLDILKEKNITDLVICGMMTHMCIDATTRAAKDFGFNITLIGDACATMDQEYEGQNVKAEDVQKSFLAALSFFYAGVTTTKKYLHKE